MNSSGNESAGSDCEYLPPTVKKVATKRGKSKSNAQSIKFSWVIILEYWKILSHTASIMLKFVRFSIIIMFSKCEFFKAATSKAKRRRWRHHLILIARKVFTANPSKKARSILTFRLAQFRISIITTVINSILHYPSVPSTEVRASNPSTSRRAVKGATGTTKLKLVFV